MNECDLCGLDDSECQCYVHELEKRIIALEEGLDSLTNVVNLMSNAIKIMRKRIEKEER